MKPVLRLWRFVAVCLICFEVLSAAESGEESKSRIPPERVELKVLKVFSAKEGEFVYRSYLVEWKGQEVVVKDPLVKTKYRTDDMITVLVMRHPFPQGKEDYGLLSFQIVPPKQNAR